MSGNRVNTSKRFLWEPAEQNAKEGVDSRTSEESSSSSSDGSNQPHQNENSVISRNSCPASSSMPPGSTIPNASNPQHHQQSAMSLLPSPVPGTPQSSVPIMPYQHGQAINQFLLSQHMSMVNAGTLQVPVNQAGPRGMKNPLRAAVNSYYYSTSNITADYRLDSSPRPQMGIGAAPPFIQAQIMRQRQHNFEQTADNPGSPFRPRHGHLQASVLTEAKGYTCGGPRHQMLLNMAIPQKEMQGSNGRALMQSEAGESSARGRKRKVGFQEESPSPSHPEQLLNWFPQGLDNQQRLALGGPTTSPPRYNISLYDPAFQTMGLPVDPHLRMFLVMNPKNAAPK